MGKKAKRQKSIAVKVNSVEEAKTQASDEKTTKWYEYHKSETKVSDGNSFIQYPKFVREHKGAISLILSFLLVFIIAYGAYSVRATTSNQAYLLGADDPYYWSRLTTYIVNGNIPQYDTLRLHPDEEPAFYTIGLFPYTGAWAYQIDHAITGIDLYRFFFYFSPIFAALSIIPAFWIGRELHSNKAGIFVAFFVAFTPSFLFRTMGGYYDTDAMIMLFSTLVVALFIAAYNRIDYKNWKKPLPIILAALAGIVLILFELTWSGWAYMPWLFAGFFIVHELYQILISPGSGIKEKFEHRLPSLKSHLMIYVVMFLSAAIFWYAFQAVMPMNGGANPLNEVKGVASFFQTAKAEGGIFPNVWISISEEMSASFSEVVARVDPVIFGFGIIGLIFLAVMFLQNFRKTSIYGTSTIYTATFIFLAIWIAPTLYGSLWAVRFIQMLAIPLAISAGIAIAVIYEWIFKLDKFSDKKELMQKISLALAVAFTIFLAYVLVFADTSPYKTSASMGNSFGSGVTLGWVTSMSWLKNNSDESSIVATYWDPGYLINSLSERATIYDGATQNNLRTTPIIELNGLDCMKDRGGYIVNNATGSYCITSRMQDMAGSLYTSDEVKAAKILESYRGDAKEMYFLASNDLIGKSQWWTYFSNWDPEKGQGQYYPYVVSSLTDQKNLILENGTALVYGPFYIKITTVNGTEKLDPLLLQNGKYFEVKTLIFYNNGTEVKMTFPDAQVPGTLWVDPSFKAVIYMPPQIEQAMFTRMFFFDGAGFKYFKEVYANSEVKIFKLDVDKLKADYPETK